MSARQGSNFNRWGSCFQDRYDFPRDRLVVYRPLRQYINIINLKLIQRRRLVDCQRVILESSGDQLVMRHDDYI